MLRNIRQLCFYFLYIAIPIVVALTLKFVGEPKKQGFFCLDDSIRYPYVSDTVRWWQVLSFSTLFPLCIILIDAFWVRFASLRTVDALDVTSEKNATDAADALASGVANDAAQLSPSSSRIEFVDVYLPRLLAFLGNGLFLIAIVDSVKYGFGRLRPYYISVCQPMIYNGSATPGLGSCALLPTNLAHGFIAPHRPAPVEGEEKEEAAMLWYKCSAIDSQSSRIKKGRQSFPSGHTAVVCYAMTYVLIYLQMYAKRAPIVRNVVQFLCVLSVLSVATSRVYDHAHHVEDVLVGAILGFVGAIHAIKTPLPVSQAQQRQAQLQRFKRTVVDVELAKKIKGDVKQ